MLLTAYRSAVSKGELRADAAQEQAMLRLHALARALRQKRGFWFFQKPPFSFFGRHAPPGVAKGLYIWGDVGRGKTLLMDLFFADVRLDKKRRAHFNRFMMDVHARIHAERQREGSGDPIPVVARALAEEARLLCFDEFQVTDVADAMILGRLFDRLFADGVIIVATSNTPPDRLYEGGLNRQLFLPFIEEIKQRLDVVELNGPIDYRLQRLSGVKVYLTPLNWEAEEGMNAAWLRLTDTKYGRATTLTVLGRKLPVPLAARGVARFSFDELCDRPLAAADYLAIAERYAAVILEGIPRLDATRRNEAQRLHILIDALYEARTLFIASAEVPPEQIYTAGDGAWEFQRTVSRLHEMQSEDYIANRAKL